MANPAMRNGRAVAQTVPARRNHPSTFRALHHRNFRLFFFGQMISLVGTWMQTIAQQWLVYRLTGSATMWGTVSLLGVLPLLPMSLWGGSLAVLVGVGFSFVTQNALANTLIQVVVPDELGGWTFQGMMRLGGMQAGVMGDAFGAPFAVGIGAAVCLAYGLFVAWRFPRVRGMA